MLGLCCAWWLTRKHVSVRLMLKTHHVRLKGFGKRNASKCTPLRDIMTELIGTVSKQVVRSWRKVGTCPFRVGLGLAWVKNEKWACDFPVLVENIKEQFWTFVRSLLNNIFALSIEKCKTLKWNNSKLWFTCPHWHSFVLSSSRSQAWQNVYPVRGIRKSPNAMGWG